MSQNDPLGDDLRTESAEERDHLQTLTDHLTKACDHDVEVIQQTTASSVRKLEGRIEELKSVERTEIQLRKNSLEWQLERLKRGVPIRKLPTEILSYIFCFYVLSGRPPWCLLEVCKGWRRIAMSTPQLWCHIRVTDAAFKWNGKIPGKYSPGSLESVNILFKGRTIVCVGIPQLQAALLRSGAVPVDIKIKSRCNQFAAINMTLSAISILISEPVSNRIERLTIDCSTLPQMLTFRDIIPGPFTLLRSIEFHASLEGWFLTMFRAVSATSTLLEHARVDCEITTELANLQVWSRTQTLALRLAGSRPGARDLNKISHRLLNLTQFPRGPFSWPSQDTPVSVWRNIQEIDLACDSIHLARLELPTLTSLIFTDLRNWNDEYTMDGFMPVSYPLLYNLKVVTSGPHWLSKVSAPLLRWFHIDVAVHGDAWARRGWQSSQLFIGCDFPALRELTFGALVDSEAMISGLRCFSNIRKLRLLSPYKRPILAVLLHLGSHTPVHCRRLGQLRIGSEEDRVEAFKKDIVPEVKRLIKSRKLMRNPLNHLSVHWNRDGGNPQAFI